MTPATASNAEEVAAALVMRCGNCSQRHKVGSSHPVMTPATVTPVPNQEKTPRRTVRVPDDVWKAAQDKAAEKGETVTDVIVRALKRYGKKADQ